MHEIKTGLKTAALRAPGETAFDSAAVDRLVEGLLETHENVLSPQMSALGKVVENNCEFGSGEFLLLRQRMHLLSSDLQRLFGREKHGVFPMIRRLTETRVLSPCRAGMIRSRVRFAILEQEGVLARLSEIRELASAQLSPGGACESCHAIIAQIDELTLQLIQHFDLEQSALFRPAEEREDELGREGGSPIGELPDARAREATQ
jgi:iron-sulfur cluster repair protein YtfE (RIC family)